MGATRPGDLMLMYGTTMFLINTLAERVCTPALWATVGAFAGTRNLAGVMATSDATAMGVRHNAATILAAPASIERTLALGGGSRSDLWLQIVSDLTGLCQSVPRITIGASFGTAFLAASTISRPDIDTWNPVVRTVQPRAEMARSYDELFKLYRDRYDNSSSVVHALAVRQRRPSDTRT